MCVHANRHKHKAIQNRQGVASWVERGMGFGSN